MICVRFIHMCLSTLVVTYHAWRAADNVAGGAEAEGSQLRRQPTACTAWRQAAIRCSGPQHELQSERRHLGARIMAAGGEALLQAGNGETDTTTHSQQRSEPVQEDLAEATERLEHAAGVRMPAETATDAAAKGWRLPALEALGGLAWRWLQTQPSSWTPGAVSPTLNLRLDGRIVPSAAVGGARVSFSHLVVLDGFFGEPERQEMMGFLTGGNAAARPLDERDSVDGSGEHAAAGGGLEAAVPGPRWTRATADRAGLQPTWGLRVRLCAHPANV